MIMYMSNTKAKYDTKKASIYDHIIAVSNRHLCSRPLAEQIMRICSLHPKAVILREKDLTEEEYTLLSRQIIDICKEYQVPCILHTYVGTAVQLECDAIHLPLPLLKDYKNTKADQFYTFSAIGTSVHSVEDALEAQELGATYLTAGHIYATDCKKGLPPRGTEFLRQICQKVHIPVYAIGGIKISEKQITEVRECGAKGGCIMSGMMNL